MASLTLHNETTISEIWETMTEDQKNAVYFIVGDAMEMGTPNYKHPGIEYRWRSLSRLQKKAVHIIVGHALADRV